MSNSTDSNSNAGKNVHILPSVLPSNPFTIEQPGTYKIQGKVTGNIEIALKRDGIATIAGIGKDPVLQGTLFEGESLEATGDLLQLKEDPNKKKTRSESHIRGAVKDKQTVVLKDFTLKGYGHNAIAFSGRGHKKIEDVNIINFTRKVSDKSLPHSEQSLPLFGAGGINAGEQSTITGGKICPGDDAVKLTDPNSSATGVQVEMSGNGSAIQLGWGGDGSNSNAEGIEISGKLAQGPPPGEKNLPEYYPGLSAIGGAFIKGGTVSNINLSKLQIQITQYTHLIYLVAADFVGKDGKKTPTIVDGIHIQGHLPNGLTNVYNDKGKVKYYAIHLEAQGNSAIKNVTIDLGSEAADPKYLYKSGNVDLNFVTSQTKA